ncbi:MAG: 3-deoxy-manno-octulosonate cytidylyltransferase [Candidatus Hydrogenedentota bacterium]
MRILGVIPARYYSTRFLGKPIVSILGKPMVQYVYEQARRSKNLEEVIVATDDTRIEEVVKKFGGKAVLTSPEHTTGTDRLTEIAFEMGKDYDIIVNIQGDEPLIEHRIIDQCIEPFRNDFKAQDVVTLVHTIKKEEDLKNPNVVKVVTDKEGFALYFSRSMIPFPFQLYKDGLKFEEAYKFTVLYRHIGIYAYKRDFLMELASWKPTPLEMIENLEQLRILENGKKIRVVETEYESVGVDIPEDLRKVEEILKHRWGLEHI